MQNIAILAYDGCWAMSIHLANDFFRIVTLLEKHQGCIASFNTTILSANGQDVISASGAKIVADAALNQQHYDIIVVPPVEGRLLRNMPEHAHAIAQWLKPFWHSNTVILALSTGAYFWANSGTVLPNQLCATHWAFISILKERFPNCTFTSAKPYLKSQNVYTTSTFEACIDVLLALVEAQKGDRFAQLCAANLLVDEPQKLAPILPTCYEHHDLAIFRVQQWIEQHCVQPVSIRDLSALFGFSERNLKRRFTLATGLPINKYLQAVRIDKAKKLLLSTDHTTKAIALAVGYENDGFFTQLFKRNTGTTPAKWRASHFNGDGSF